MPYSAADVRARPMIGRILLCAPPKQGKAQPVDELVLTPTGWNMMGALKVGDAVVGASGKSTRITGVFPQGKKKIVRVIADCGSSARCSIDHLWYTSTRSELYQGARGGGSAKSVLDVRRTIDAVHFIPRVGPVHFSESPLYPLRIDPYFLGLLLGDGTFTGTTGTSICFHSNDEELCEAVLRAAMAIGDAPVRFQYGNGSDELHTPGIRINGSALKGILGACGLYGARSEGKFIPQGMLFISPEDRLELLRGLCDTDGSAMINPTTGTSTSVEYSTSSTQLKDDVLGLVRSLGGRASATLRETDVLPAWRVRLSFDDICPFKLRRKADLWRTERQRFRRQRIVGVEDLGEEECVCIAVDAPDHLYVTRDFLVTHNTTCAVSTSPGPVYVMNTDGKGGLDPVALRGVEFEADDITNLASFRLAMNFVLANKARIKTVVFDNLTTFASMVEAETKLELKPDGSEPDGRQFYPLVKQRILTVVRALFALPLNVVLCGHTDIMTASSGAFGHILAITGGAKQQIPILVQDWIWLELTVDPADPTQAKREFLLAPQGNWTKGVRSVKDVSRMDANITKFLELAQSQRQVKTAPRVVPAKVSNMSTANRRG